MFFMHIFMKINDIEGSVAFFVLIFLFKSTKSTPTMRTRAPGRPTAPPCWTSRIGAQTANQRGRNRPAAWAILVPMRMRKEAASARHDEGFLSGLIVFDGWYEVTHFSVFSTKRTLQGIMKHKGKIINEASWSISFTAEWVISQLVLKRQLIKEQKGNTWRENGKKEGMDGWSHLGGIYCI